MWATNEFQSHQGGRANWMKSRVSWQTYEIISKRGLWFHRLVRLDRCSYLDQRGPDTGGEVERPANTAIKSKAN